MQSKNTVFYCIEKINKIKINFHRYSVSVKYFNFTFTISFVGLPIFISSHLHKCLVFICSFIFKRCFLGVLDQSILFHLDLWGISPYLLKKTNFMLNFIIKSLVLKKYCITRGVLEYDNFTKKFALMS